MAVDKYDPEILTWERAISIRNALSVVEGENKVTASAGVVNVEPSPEPGNRSHPEPMYQDFCLSLLTPSSDEQTPERKRTSWTLLSLKSEAPSPFTYSGIWKFLFPLREADVWFVFPGRSWILP